MLNSVTKIQAAALSRSIVLRCASGQVQAAVCPRSLGADPAGDGAPNVDVAAAAASRAEEREALFKAKWDAALPFQAIPGPKPIPVIGNMWRFVPGIGEWSGQTIFSLLKQWREDYGNIMTLKGVFGKEDFVALYNPEDIEILFRTEGKFPIRTALEPFAYYRSVVRKDIFKEIGGLVSVHGQPWYKIRSQANKYMLPPKVVRSYIPGLEQVTVDLLKKVDKLLAESPNSELPMDFMNELNRWGLESICFIALDTRLGCFDDNMTYDAEPQKMIDAVNDMFDLLYDLDVMPSIWKYASTPKYRRFVRTMDYITSVCMKHIAKTEENLKNKPVTDRPPSLLEELLKGDKLVAITMAIDILSAGIDTTSKTAAAFMYYMARDQRAQDKLREELTRLLPDPDAPLTSELINQMKYLRAGLKESQRISPIAIGHVRTTQTDLVFSGYQIPRGTRIMTANITLCQSDEHFPNATKFIPERWTVDGPPEISAKNSNPFVYLPFGFGSRTCIGKRIAFGELEILLAKMFRKYKFEWNHPDIEFRMKLLYEVASPLQFKLTPVQK